MIKVNLVRLYRLVTVLLLTGVLGFAGTVLALRYWILPNIESYRSDIAASISEAAGQRVSIGSIAADWQGLRPHLVLRDVQVYDSAGRPALTLGHVENTLSWWSLLSGEIRLHSLVIERPQIAVRRETDGLIYVAGIAVNRSAGDSGFADWALRQRHIIVRGAQIEWLDAMRKAPPLSLRDVDVRLENRGSRHRFGLRATPPAELATPLDLRGDLTGTSVSRLGDWAGKLYVRLDNTDIAAWQRWFPLPFEMSRGAGGLRLWLGFTGPGVTDVAADVRAQDVVARLGHDLPELQLTTLSGSLAWQRLEQGFELKSRSLGFQTAGSVALPPTDLTLRVKTDALDNILSGQIDARQLALAPLAALAGHLPLARDFVERLTQLDPQGELADVTAKWEHAKGGLTYTARARLAGAGVKPMDKFPGFTNLSGNVDASDRGGTLSLDSRVAELALPQVFREPLQFDSLTAQVAWKIRHDEVEVKINNVAFANGHAAGGAQGTYRTAPRGPGRIDLTGQISRADARFVARYLPSILDPDARTWLEHAFLGGEGGGADLVLKGDLADFPFVDRKKGIFQVKARVSNVDLHYADGWPNIDNITGELLFEGKRMEINARQAGMFGMRLGPVRVAIPDLLSPDERVLVDGQAQGATQEALGFIDRSPVAEMIDRFTEGMQASGNGALALKLDIPIRHSKDTRVSGAYQFYNNRVVVDPDLPPLEQVNGRLEFTDAGVRIPGMNALLLGTPVAFNAVTQKDGTSRISAAGRFNPAAARRTWGATGLPAAVMAQMRGQADWRAAIVLKKKQADVTVDSNLQGLAVDLPAPFGKAAGDVVPLQLQRRLNGAQQDTVSLSYGRVMSGQFARREENGAMQVERGEISFGGQARLPRQPGLFVTGALPALDIDYWRGLSERGQGGAAGAGKGSPLVGINLKVGALDTAGRRFNDLTINARLAGNEWSAQLNGRELAGDLRWNPEGKGRVVARLKQLTLPDSTSASAAPSNPQQHAARELPALDIAVDALEVKRKKLGRLELVAVQEGADWRIEKLRLATPEATLGADGVWAAWLRDGQTRVNVKLEVQDLGKFLARFGYPETVRRGTARLTGQLAWAGSPQDLDFATLSGDLALDAKSGQFLKVEPGLGKLIGIVSLQALPRRITLDFRDVFSDGFAFDEISGALRINRGVMSSDDFKMNGPAAKVLMRGQTDLARETQQLNIRVTPLLGDSVSVAGALLGGPVVGLTTLILQKALRNPIDQIASYEYKVTGSWADPKVAKLQPHAPAQAEQ